MLAVLVVAMVGFSTPVLADSDEKVTPFHFTSFNADYYLSRDAEGFSKLTVKEILVAEFATSGNYNHGIERALPKYYKFDGAAKTETHSFDLRIDRVAGGSWTTYNSGDFTVIRIGDADEMVHGMKKYEIDWSATNVTRNFDDGDEFYWNTNGTGWTQYFDLVEVGVHIPADLATALDGRVKCGIGEHNRLCRTEIFDEKDGGKLFIFESRSVVQSNETLTFDIGFKQGTFTRPPFDIGAIFDVPTAAFWTITISATILMIGVIIWLVIVIKKFRPTKTGRAIIPEYLPPKNMSVAESAFWFKSLVHGQQTFFPATLINLAVNHYVEIIEEKKALGNKKFSIKLLKLPDNHISEDDISILGSVFAGKLTVGEIVKTSDLQSMSQSIMGIMKRIQKNLQEKREFYRTNPNLNTIPTIAMVALFLVAIFTAVTLESILPLILAPAAIILLIAVILFKPISAKGMEAKEYLIGLKMYMELAEAERLKFLQSIKGAERVTTDKGEIVKLYEKLLPFAVIFGITKDWAKALQVYYDQNPSLVPVWYVGNLSSLGSFNAASFASSINSFSNSGSGFSSGGGGFSGGGGGGGGGGGW